MTSNICIQVDIKWHLTGEPSLFREIARVAWRVAKVFVITTLVSVSIVFPLRQHPVAAIVVLCIGAVVFQIIYVGWQDYNRKKRDWIRQQRNATDGSEGER